MSFSLIDGWLSHLIEQGKKSHKTVIIMIDGYEDTSEELFEIMQVRDWISALFQKYPYFLYFINTSLDSHITLLSCIADIDVRYSGDVTLSLNEYKRLGIDPLRDVKSKEWTITSLSNESYIQMERSLIEHGNRIGDFDGASETIEMIKIVTNRNFTFR